MTSGTGAAIKVEEISPIKKKISFEILGRGEEGNRRRIPDGGEEAKIKGFRPEKTPSASWRSLARE